MFRNYFKTAIRHISRSKFFALLNVTGLAAGVAFTLLIAAYCWSEGQVNHQLRHYDRQYALTSRWKNPGMGMALTTLGPLARALKENYPGLVANYYRFDAITSTFSNGDKHFREVVQMGDSTLLPMYGFPLLQGDAATALNDPFTVVISADRAMKYFGRTDVVGRTLTVENFSGSKKDFLVTGVMKDPERNSVTWVNEANNNRVFVSASNLAFFNRNMNWSNPAIVGYVELQKGVRPEALAEPIAHLIKQNAAPLIADNLVAEVQPLASYYLTGNGGTVHKMLYTLSFVAGFILLMAVINFINLSVSRSTTRMKEIGVRKVLGSLRRQLRVQFLTESILLSVMATVVALGLYSLFAPMLSGMLGKAIPSLTSLPVYAWPLIAAFAVITGWLAGLYPAVLLSSLGSIDSLKGRVGAVHENVLLRKGLVGFQFVTATVALVGAIIVSQQIDLFFSDRLGYDREYVLSVQLPRDWSLRGVQKMETVRAGLAELPAVKDVTMSYEIPNGMNGGNARIYREGGDSSRAVLGETLVTDEHYAGTYRIPMAEGVFYNAAGESAAQDSMRIVLNETAVRAMGWKNPKEAVGQRVRVVGGSLLTVSGVIKDFHFGPMGSPINPEVFIHVSLAWNYRFFSFKLRPGNIGQTVNELQRKWAALLPGAAFEYRFMDETLENLYQNELRLKKAASLATILSLVIVLLGVVGLLSLSVQKRTKEIAIRKVVGASVPGIIRLFLREYLPLLLLSGVIATPLAWLVMDRWLSDYATRITITPWPFIIAIAGLCVLMAGLITGQTIRAALANPVKSLKSE